MKSLYNERTNLFLVILTIMKFDNVCYSFLTSPKLQVAFKNTNNEILSLALNDEDNQSVLPLQIDDRRSFLSSTTNAAVTAFLSSSALLNQPEFAYGDEGSKKPKILVLGGTGLVGSEVCRQLKNNGIRYIATSRDGRDNTKVFDALKSTNIVQDIKKLCDGQDCTGIISTIGSISNTSNDYIVNSASGYAAIAANEIGTINHYVYISVSPDVRNSVKGLGVLEDYMAGKVFSESSIQSNFGGNSKSYCIIQPTFIYGGDKFGINPPRVTKSYGGLVEGLLSSSPFRALEGISPGLISVALKPPIPVEAIASAAIVGALGKTSSSSSVILDNYDSILATAALL